MVLLQTLSLFCLSIIIYQDFKFRGVYWLCFPLLAIILGSVKSINKGVNIVFTDGLFSLGFLLFQLLFLCVYFAMKEKRVVNITKGHIGWGDILFLLTLCFYLTPVDYVLFYLSSLLFTLGFVIIAKWINNEFLFTIPLAGIQALFFAFVLVSEWFLNIYIFKGLAVYIA